MKNKKKKKLNFNIIEHKMVKDPHADCYYVYVHANKKT